MFSSSNAKEDNVEKKRASVNVRHGNPEEEYFDAYDVFLFFSLQVLGYDYYLCAAVFFAAFLFSPFDADTDAAAAEATAIAAERTMSGSSSAL